MCCNEVFVAGDIWGVKCIRINSKWNNSMIPKYETLGCKIKITKNFMGAIVIWSK